MENTIKEIDERHNAMKDLQGGIADLREVFVEVSSMLEVTGLEEIEDKVSRLPKLQLLSQATSCFRRPHSTS